LKQHRERLPVQKSPKGIILNRHREDVIATYRIGDEIVDRTDSGFSERLGSVHKNKDRPLCLCRPAGIAMYVVRIEGRFYIKRMPNTGGEHAPDCGSYEPPAELSGLGQVLGSAIVENPDLGTTALKLDFSLTKSPGRSAPVPGACEAGSVRTDGNKLTLRALLHYLWEEAGFQKWSPSMNGKRNWSVIRKYLLLAAEHKIAKGGDLSAILYVPEPFVVERKEAIAQRRMAQLSRVAEAHGQPGPRRLMLLVGEVKEIGASRYGHKLVVKHSPDFHFMMNDDVHKRLNKRFDVELSLWDAMEGAHLLAAATFGVNAAGVAGVEEIALMVVNENWIPFESRADKSLLDKLTREGRRFVKGMRYNLPAARPLAAAVLTDTPAPTAMYIHPPGGADDYARTLEELIGDSKLASWVWRQDDGAMPALPQR
jgi:hypothetical protein